MIEDEREIEKALLRLARNDCVLTGNVAPSEQMWRTSLLKVDAARQRLLLDELLPTPTRGALDKTRTIDLSGWLDDVAIAFSVGIRNAHSGENGQCLSTHFPTAIQHEQRRETYRVRMMSRDTLYATLRPNGADVHKAEVVDLSIGGIGLLLPDARPLPARDVLECVVALPGKPMATTIEPRSVRRTGRPPRTRVGGRFVQLTADARGAISRYIASVQRERIRALNEHRNR